MENENQTTGLPLLRTWRSVYLFVLIFFIVLVVLMFTLERSFQ